MYRQFRYDASRRTARSNFGARRSHSAVKALSKRRIGSHSARSGRDPRDDLDDRIDHRGDQPIEWRRQVRHARGATREWLHEAGDQMRLRPMQTIDHAAWLFGRAECEDGAAVAIPGTNERFVEPLSIALGRDHRARAPRAVDLHPLQRQTNGQRGVLADDSRAFAGDPDAGLSGRVVRVAAMLPVPSKTNRLGSVGAVRASIKRVYAAAIVRDGSGRCRTWTQRDCVYCTTLLERAGDRNEPLTRGLFCVGHVSRRRRIDRTWARTTRDDAERISWRRRRHVIFGPAPHRPFGSGGGAFGGQIRTGDPTSRECAWRRPLRILRRLIEIDVSGSGRFWNCGGGDAGCGGGHAAAGARDVVGSTRILSKADAPGVMRVAREHHVSGGTAKHDFERLPLRDVGRVEA